MFFIAYQKHGIQRSIEEYYKVRFTVNVTTCQGGIRTEIVRANQQ